MASNRGGSGLDADGDCGDDDLVRRVQLELPHGTTAFRLLVERHEKLVFGRALRLVGDPADAEEVVQDVFLRVFRSIGRFRFEKPVVHWLQTIATNAARNFLRGRYRDQRKRSELAESLRGAVTTPEPRDVTRLAELQKALAELDPTTRVAVSLRFVEEHSDPEIAEHLGMRESAVKMRVRRGLVRLRETLGGNSGGDE